MGHEPGNIEFMEDEEDPERSMRWADYSSSDSDSDFWGPQHVEDTTTVDEDTYESEHPEADNLCVLAAGLEVTPGKSERSSKVDEDAKAKAKQNPWHLADEMIKKEDAAKPKNKSVWFEVDEERLKELESDDDVCDTVSTGLNVDAPEFVPGVWFPSFLVCPYIPEQGPEDTVAYLMQPLHPAKPKKKKNKAMKVVDSTVPYVSVEHINGIRTAEIDWANREVQRARQIAIGKATEGYKRYKAGIPEATDPPTPRTDTKECRKDFNHEIKIWREFLHMFD